MFGDPSGLPCAVCLVFVWEEWSARKEFELVSSKCCQTFTNVIVVCAKCLQVSESPLCGHDAAQCRRNDADQHQVLQKDNALSLSNSRTHVNNAFVWRHNNSNLVLYSVFS